MEEFLELEKSGTLLEIGTYEGILYPTVFCVAFTFMFIFKIVRSFNVIIGS